MADEKPTEAGGTPLAGGAFSEDEFFWLAFQMISLATNARRMKAATDGGDRDGFREALMLHANFVRAWLGKVGDSEKKLAAVTELFARCHKLLSS